jgi:secreted trypsin-like serine protease
MYTDKTTISDTFSQLLPSPLKVSSSAKTILASSPTSLVPLGRDSYLGVGIYGSPEHSDDDDSDSVSGHSDSTLEDESFMLFGHPLERMPRLKSADHGPHYEQDLNLLLLASRSSRSSSKSDSVISTTSGASYDAM